MFRTWDLLFGESERERNQSSTGRGWIAFLQSFTVLDEECAAVTFDQSAPPKVCRDHLESVGLRNIKTDSPISLGSSSLMGPD